MPKARATTRPKPALRGFVVATILGMIAMNVAANAVPFFGRGTGEVSALYPALVTPAGYVFAIWGVIYLGLLAYSIGQFVSPLDDEPLPDRLAWPLIISNVANVVWLLLWHSLNINWTVPVMLILLASLVTAYLISRASRPEPPTVLERWTVRAPLSVYLGWISVATIANISGALGAAGWNGWGIAPEWWAVIMLVVASVLALIGVAREADGVFAAVFVWAFAGIAVATPSPTVRMAASALAAIVGVGILASALTRKRFI